MADVVFTAELDVKGLEDSLKSGEKVLKKFQRKQKTTKTSQAKEEKSTQKEITRNELAELKKREANDKRLSRRRARNRLKQIKARLREENRLEREATRARVRAERDRTRKRQRVGRGIRSVGRGVGGVAARGAGIGVAAIGLNVASLFDAREALSFERSLALLAGQADISAGAQANLGQAITKTSLAFGAFRGDVLRGVEKVVEKSGDLNLATDIITTMSKAAIGLDADLGDLGELAASLGTSFKISGKDMEEFFNILIAQGDKGQVTLKNFARISEEVFGTAAGFGVRGKGGINAISALIQASVGSADERKTAIVSFLEQLTAKEAKINKLGVKVRGPKGELRDISTIVKDVIKATGGSVGAINKIFTGAGLKPFLLSASEFKDTKKFASLDKFLGAGAGSKGLIDKRFQRVQKTSSVSFDKFSNLITILGEKTLAPVLADFAEGLDALLKDPAAMKDLIEGFEGIGVAIKSVAVVATNLITVLGKLFSFVHGAATILNNLNPLAPSQFRATGGSIRTGAGQTIVTNHIKVDATRKTVKGKTTVDQNNPLTGQITRTHVPIGPR